MKNTNDIWEVRVRQGSNIFRILGFFDGKERMEKNPKFWTGYDERFGAFKLGILLKQARVDAGLTQEQIAKRLKTTKSVVSRMENHATDIRLSTLDRFAKALGRKIHVALR